MHPSLEVPAGGRGWWAHDSSPRNVEGWGKSCAGNITSLAKVPGKCQNEMCWLCSGNEKSIPGFPEANPSTSQHPSPGGELATDQFSSAPRTAPRVPLLGSHPGLSVPGTVPGTALQPMKGTALLPSTWGLTIWFREKTDMQGKLNTQCRVFVHAAEGPFQPMLGLTSIRTFGCH